MSYFISSHLHRAAKYHVWHKSGFFNRNNSLVNGLLLQQQQKHKIYKFLCIFMVLLLNVWHFHTNTCPGSFCASLHVFFKASLMCTFCYLLYPMAVLGWGFLTVSLPWPVIIHKQPSISPHSRGAEYQDTTCKKDANILETLGWNNLKILQSQGFTSEKNISNSIQLYSVTQSLEIKTLAS